MQMWPNKFIAQRVDKPSNLKMDSKATLAISFKTLLLTTPQGPKSLGKTLTKCPNVICVVDT